MQRFLKTSFIALLSGFFIFIYFFVAEASSFQTWWGNVGIGKIPVANLDIIGGNNSTGVVNATSLCINTVCKTSWAEVASGGLPTATAGQTVRYNGTAWATSSLLFNTGTNIGINTTNPQAVLDVFSAPTIGFVPAPTTTNNFVVTSTGYTGTIQTWTVPTTGTYTIDAYGAQGGQGTNYTQYAYGKGARMKGTFSLTAGDVIKILVGQKGLSGTNDGGGGGGTFVVKSDNTILVIAGGGGGASYSGAGADAVTTTSGTAGPQGGTGGTGGGGGTSAGYAGAGAGFTSNGGNGASSSCGGGYSYLNGGNGGQCNSYTTVGGFGGGGGTHGGGWGGGGGGGYSGGGASTSSQYGGGGGGSYNAGTSQSNTAGYNSGDGKVIITSVDIGTVLATVQTKAANFGGNISVTGGVKLGEPGVSCSSSIEGSIKYATSTKTFMGCNGTAWMGLVSGNTTPDPFSFIGQTGLNVATTTISNIVQVNGIISVAVSASGAGSPQIRTCSDASCSNVILDWTNAGSILNGKYLQARQTSSSASLGVNTASIAVGSTIVSWAITTGNTTPTAFSFTVPSLQALNTVVSSNIVQISGLTIPSLVVVGGSGSPQYRTCSDSACATVLSDWATTSATIANTKYLQLRATSPSTSNSTTTATVSLGTSTTPFYVPTGSDLVNAFSIANSTSVYLNSMASSTPVQITGNTIPASITVSGGGSPTYRVCTDSACANPIGNTTYNNSSTGYTGTIYSWTVPTSGIYTIDAYGAKGGNATSYGYTGGKGARMKGDFILTAGEVIKILVGQTGADYSYEGMGGGGTFVVKQTGNIPLVVAGGGGGASGNSSTNSAGMDASITTTSTASNGGQCPGVAGPAGGTACSNASGGGGFSTNGGAGSGSYGGYSYLNGGNGGSCAYGQTVCWGGFGGGGGSHGGGWGGGGGGGYAGGSAYTAGVGGGGGGSYNAGSNQTNTAGNNNGYGKVIITAPSAVISSGQYIQVLLNAAKTASTATTATVSIGSSNVSATYTATTGTGSATAFSFTDQTGVARSSVILSNIIQITTTATVGVTITGTTSPQFRICSNSTCSTVVTDWTNAANISSGQYLQARMTSAYGKLTAVSSDIYVGDKTDNWSITTYNQTDPTNMVLTHTANRKTFTVSWTAGLNNGGSSGCKLQFMDQNVSGTWKDITGATLNCDATLTNQTVTLPESFTTSWSGTHQVRIFILNMNEAGSTFSQTLSCTSTSASTGTPTPSIDEDCNGQFDNTTVWYTSQNSCSNQGNVCEGYDYYSATGCTGSVSWSSGYWCSGSFTPFCSSNYYYYHEFTETRANGCIWDDEYYYYY